MSKNILADRGGGPPGGRAAADQSRRIAGAFDAKARDWSGKGRWVQVIGDDSPLGLVVDRMVGDHPYVVDVGGGAGRDLRRLAEARTTGVFILLELSRSMARRGSQSLSAVDSPGSRVVTMVADAARIPLPSRCCDAVILRQVLHHAGEPSLLVREASRILRPGGRLFAQVPGPNYLAEWHRYPGAHARDGIGRFSAAEVEALLREAGLRPEVRAYPFRFRFESLLHVLRFFEGVALLDRLVGYQPGSSRCFSQFLQAEPIGHVLQHLSVTPIEVGCEYILGIGEKTGGR